MGVTGRRDNNTGSGGNGGGLGGVRRPREVFGGTNNAVCGGNMLWCQHGGGNMLWCRHGGGGNV
ncbi:unnamed protein product [Cuscuta epithymum]|uniref:Uncharacterized protein n=1 Tax=Cuscuta epithymum TaxID=186058 RepID=A0AAV0DL84_9ASTE|nr:unnamed protein product [Cuscuta epithymum]